MGNGWMRKGVSSLRELTPSIHSPFPIPHSLHLDLPLAHQNTRPPNPHPSHLATGLVDFNIDLARAAHLDTLFDAPLEHAVGACVAGREIAAEGGAGGSG